jgi:NADH-quinone oxidoreductase subunit J
MTIAGFFFYLFDFVTIASAIMVISARNPVHAVLFLILAFFNSAGLFLLLGAEFIALILIIVYVGAVAVLFLFVVMMLDVDFAELRAGYAKFLPIGGLIGGILLAQLLLVVTAWTFAPQGALQIAEPIPAASAMSNTEAIGRVMYTTYIYFFQLAGMILLVAMIGAIVLTLRHREGVKRQDVATQVARDPAAAIEIRQVETGKGIGLG